MDETHLMFEYLSENYIITNVPAQIQMLLVSVHGASFIHNTKICLQPENQK